MLINCYTKPNLKGGTIYRLMAALCCLLFFVSCRSINRSAAEIGMPPKTVVFSFDDGPNSHADTTSRLLDVLQKYHVRAMFMLLGENAESNPGLVKRMRDEGHYLVNHGYSEKWACQMGKEEFRAGLEKAEAAIAAAAEAELFPKLYRPQGGYYTAAQEKVLKEKGYTVIPGSARAYDAVLTGKNREKVVNEIVKKIKKQNGGLILLHDARDSHFSMEKKLLKNPDCSYNRSWIPAAVEDIITELIDSGFTFGDPALSAASIWPGDAAQEVTVELK